MIVKRKNNGLQSKEYLENIEEKVKVGSTNTLLQKAKEAYNGLPFEFKGWVDINHVELFNGLKGKYCTHTLTEKRITVIQITVRNKLFLFIFRAPRYFLFKNLLTGIKPKRH